MKDLRIIHLPYFIYLKKNLNELSGLQKLVFIFQGKIISILNSKLSDKKFIFVINNFFNFKNKLKIEDNLISIIENQNEYYFPNIFRSLVFLHGFDIQHNLFLESYCLDKIDFQENDVIIDCGANLGELNLALKSKNVNAKYIAFEPDQSVFYCLELNNIDQNSVLHNVALSDKNEEKSLYVDSVGGNSSLQFFGIHDNYKINCKKLDDYQIENIKLIKMDTEGHELEALKGSINTLKITEFVSVDFGNEKGENQEHTIVSVSNFLFSAGFELFEYSNSRMVGLFRNKTYK
tara:strand:- start:551 stop:1423 length:873 start_codon:yes stop_codon:yes gene_type:complete